MPHLFFKNSLAENSAEDAGSGMLMSQNILLLK